jgi:hypothetical protein
MIKRIKNIVLCVFVIGISGGAIAQLEIDSTTVKKLNKYDFGGVYPSTISGTIGGVCEWGGVTYDLILSPQWALEVGGGIVGAGVGLNYYFKPIKRGELGWRLNYRSIYYLGASQHVWQNSLCFGFTYFAISKINIGVDIGPSFRYGFATRSSSTPPIITELPLFFTGAIKVGYRFSFKIIQRRRELDKEQREKDLEEQE